MVKLFIDNKEIDLSENFNIEYTYQSLDASEPAAIKNSFSKTIEVPGTPNNNKVFGDCWRLDRNIIESKDSYIYTNFDPRKRVPFIITRYGGVIESGYIQLNTISVKENSITYNITCFSGLGDFFYNLMTNEDGTEKSLADLYYGWCPVFGMNDNNMQLTREQEANDYIMNWTSETITRSYKDMLPIDISKDLMAENITNHITAIPVYNGLYDDFKSDTMIMDNFGGLWDGVRTYTGRYGEQLTDEMYDVLKTNMPSQIEKDGNIYTEVRFPAGQAHRWQVTRVERDMEPFEARDLRVTKMNAGLKLLKLMQAISDPSNNGGYTVEWDESITSSPYWNYSWIMLGKPDFDIEDTGTSSSGGVNVASLSGRKSQSLTWNYTPVSLQGYSDPKLVINYAPKFHAYIDEWTNEDAHTINNLMNSVSMYKQVDRWGKWGTLYSIFRIYDGTRYISQFHTLFYFGYGINFGKDRGGKQWVTMDKARHDIQDALMFAVPNMDKNADVYITDLNNTPELLSANSKILEWKDERVVGRMYRYSADVVAQFPTKEISRSLPDDIRDLRVTVDSYEVGYCYNFDRGTYTVLIDKDVAGDHDIDAEYLRQSFWGEVELHPMTYTIDYILDSKGVSTVIDGSTSSYSLARVTKKILLGGTESPYKYLTDFTKLLNLKYIFDKPTKTIKIVPKNKYYIDETVDLTDKIDYGKEVQVKPLLTNTKYISLNLETPQTYAVKLYNSKNNIDYSAFKFDTKYDFNNDINNIFEDSIFREVIPYQLKSNFFNTKSSMGRFMSIFDVISHTNTLFRKEGNEVIVEDKEDTLYNFLGTSTSSFDANAKDIVPKLCTFDKEIAHDDDCQNSFVFFNGYYRNYYYDECTVGNGSKAYCLFPNLMLSDKIPVMDTIAGGECYMWSFNWGDDYVRQLDITYALMLYSAAPLYMPYFSKYLYHDFDFMTAEWTPTENIKASWHIAPPKQMTASPSEIPFVHSNRISRPTLYYEPWYEDYNVNISDFLTSSKYIYPQFWKNELEDLYDKNGKQVVVYARLEDEPDEALRKFYFFDGCYWIITKIENYSITNRNDWFNKITFVRVKNKENYLS